MIELTYRDTRRSVVAVRLASVTTASFTRHGRTWRLRLASPPVDRLEYELEIEHADGTVERSCDPANPNRAPGPFGEKSVLELPGYRPPAWLDGDAPPGDITELAVRSRPFRKDVPVLLWSPAGAQENAKLPLLVVHDGPETDEYGSLTRLLDHLVAAGRIRPFRAALLAPIDRNEHYSASAAYARTLAWDVLPALPSPPRRRFRIGVGVSLGALALLHAHRRHPEAFGALFLQSGSFFRPETDRQERSFPRFDRISRFVGRLLRGTDVEEPDPIPVTLTCGLGEENLANNRAVAAALTAQGYEVRMAEVRDAHTWAGWRDAWDPWLVELVARVWR